MINWLPVIIIAANNANIFKNCLWIHKNIISFINNDKC